MLNPKSISHRNLLYIYQLIQIISQNIHQQRHHQINVPAIPQVNISNLEMSVSNIAKAVNANGNEITNAIVKSSKQFLTVVFTEIVTKFFTSIRSLPLSLGFSLLTESIV